MISPNLSDDCTAYAAGPLVKVDETTAFVPDVLIECQRSGGLGPMYIEPSIVFAVLSPSTKTYDRTTKLQRYINDVDSICEVVIVDPESESVEQF